MVSPFFCVFSLLRRTQFLVRFARPRSENWMRIRILLLALISVLAAISAVAATGSKSDPAVPPPAIVLGFVGGFVHHDDMAHTEVRLAARLRSEFPQGVHSEIVENHKGAQAYAEILKLLDTNHDGNLSFAEKRAARIILYGHSWGASEAINLARQLDRDEIPVLLTIQVDSITKGFGTDDSLVPANVAEAANFYQPHSFLHGENSIHAANPARTKILGNFRFDYSQKPAACVNSYPWWDRHIMKSHIEIECDPNVWNRVEALIRAKLSPAESSETAALTLKP
jgi:hypothetical protein